MRDNVPNLLATTFKKVEAQVRMLGAADVGATCCSAYFCHENGKKRKNFKKS